MKHALGDNTNCLLSALVSAGLLIGCSESLDPASLLSKTRPLGIRLSVAGDSDRTRPRAEETLNLTLLMGHAAEELPVSFFGIFCVPAPTTVGIPFCQSGPDGNPIFVGGPVAANGVVGDPAFQLDVPSDAELDALGVDDSLLMLGAVCQGSLAPITRLENLFEGSPTDVNPCDNAADEGTILTSALSLLRGGAQPNENPGVGGIVVGVGFWDSTPGSTDLATGCSGMDLPQVRAGRRPLSLLVLVGGAEEFNESTADGEIIEVRESLLITSLATAGKMQRTFSVVEPGEFAAEVLWEAPLEGVDSDGTRVRFEFVVRDGRGGIDRIRRQLCVVP